MSLLLLFCILNIMNVIMQTATHICTIRCGKWESATINAIAYGLYAIVIVYMVCDLSLPLKVIIVAITNFIGVLVVKKLEENFSKKKFWKVEVVCGLEEVNIVIMACEENNIVPIIRDSFNNATAIMFCSAEQKNNITKIFERENIVYFLAESAKPILKSSKEDYGEKEEAL